MTNKELKEILDQHQIWLEDRSKGKRADLRRVDFSGVDLSGVNLSRADLRRANFSGANLVEANLSGAILRGVNLQGVDLQGVDLRYVYIGRANLFGADLTKIKDYKTTEVYLVMKNNWKLVLAKEITTWQKMIADKDKNLAILYKNTWMAESCKEILKGR